MKCLTNRIKSGIPAKIIDGCDLLYQLTRVEKPYTRSADPERTRPHGTLTSHDLISYYLHPFISQLPSATFDSL